VTRRFISEFDGAPQSTDPKTVGARVPAANGLLRSRGLVCGGHALCAMNANMRRFCDVSRQAASPAPAGSS